MRDINKIAYYKRIKGYTQMIKSVINSIYNTNIQEDDKNERN